MKYFVLLRNNLRGVLAGVAYAITAWFLMAFGLSFGDMCDVPSQVCNDFGPVSNVIFVFSAPNFVIWSFLEYFLVQMPLVAILGDQAGPQLAEINNFVVPVVFVPMTIFFWATVGATIQEFSRRTRK